ncbi:hypothetical protein M8C21_030196, partial [Ambrosia artemisiifolia]
MTLIQHFFLSIVFYNKPMNSWSLKCLSNNLWREMFLGMIESGNTIGVISDGTGESRSGVVQLACDGVIDFVGIRHLLNGTKENRWKRLLPSRTRLKAGLKRTELRFYMGWQVNLHPTQQETTCCACSYQRDTTNTFVVNVLPFHNSEFFI